MKRPLWNYMADGVGYPVLARISHDEEIEGILVAVATDGDLAIVEDIDTRELLVGNQWEIL